MLQRPFLYSGYGIYDFIRKNFDFNANIPNFLNKIDNLMFYRKFFSEIENKTKNTDFKITVVYNPIEYQIPNYTHVDLIQKFENEKNKYPETFIDKKINNLKYEFYENLNSIFGQAKREGEIFINGKFVSNFKIYLKDNGWDFIHVEITFGKEIFTSGINRNSKIINDWIIEKLLDFYISSKK